MAESREQAFQGILERSRARLARVARAYAPAEDAQDLYQDILLQIWKSLDRFEGRAQPDTWAYRIALNTAMTWRRRQGSRPTLTPDEQDAAGEVPGDAGDPLRVLEEFLASLTKTDRALLLLYLEDLSYRDIGDILGISESYVGVKLNRLKQAFIERHIRG